MSIYANVTYCIQCDSCGSVDEVDTDEGVREGHRVEVDAICAGDYDFCYSTYGNDVLCQSCFDDAYSYCDGCGEYVDADTVRYSESSGEYRCNACSSNIGVAHLKGYSKQLRKI